MDYEINLEIWARPKAKRKNENLLESLTCKLDK